MKKIIVFVSSASYLLEEINFFDFLPNVDFILFINKNEIVSKEIKSVFKKIYWIENFGPWGISNKAQDEILSAVKKECGNKQEVFFYSYNELLQEFVANIEEILNKKKLNKEKISFFRDKLKMRKYLLPFDVRQPKFLFDIFETDDLHRQYYCVVKALGQFFILKAVNLFGSKGVYLIKTVNDFKKATKFFKTNKLKYYAEEFIAGDLYHCDCIVTGGVIVKQLLSKYNLPLDAIKYGHNVGSIPLLADPDGLKLFAENLLSKFALMDGIYHIEIFKKHYDNRAYLLEIASRPGGAYINRVYTNMFGINLLQIDFCVKTKLSFDCSTQNGMPSAWLYVAKHHTVFRGLCFPNECLSSTFEYKLNAVVGEQLKPSQCVGDKAASMLIKNKNYEALCHDFDFLTAKNLLG